MHVINDMIMQHTWHIKSFTLYSHFIIFLSYIPYWSWALGVIFTLSVTSGPWFSEPVYNYRIHGSTVLEDMRVWLNHGATHASVIPKRAFFPHQSKYIRELLQVRSVNQSSVVGTPVPRAPCPLSPLDINRHPFLIFTFLILGMT